MHYFHKAYPFCVDSQFSKKKKNERTFTPHIFLVLSLYFKATLCIDKLIGTGPTEVQKCGTLSDCNINTTCKKRDTYYGCWKYQYSRPPSIGIKQICSASSMWPVFRYTETWYLKSITGCPTHFILGLTLPRHSQRQR